MKLCEANTLGDIKQTETYNTATKVFITFEETDFPMDKIDFVEYGKSSNLYENLEFLTLWWDCGAQILKLKLGANNNDSELSTK